MRTATQTSSYKNALSAVRSLTSEDKRKLVAQLNREQMLEALKQIPILEEEISMENIVAEIKLARKENGKESRS
jgi:hypothetical protein